MALNAQEFRKRSEDFFAATYLNSVGIIQSISLGVLADKLYTGLLSPQAVLQSIAAFLAIVIVANEYSWWIMLIRRTPDVFDYLIPYSLGAVEFGVMVNVVNTDGVWFLAAGVLALGGILSLFHNRRYATRELFAECAWLRPRVRHNLVIGMVLVAVAAIVMLGAWFSRKHLGIDWEMVVFGILYAIQIAMLVVTTVFMKGVRKRFEAELS